MKPNVEKIETFIAACLTYWRRSLIHVIYYFRNGPQKQVLEPAVRALKEAWDALDKKDQNIIQGKSNKEFNLRNLSDDNPFLHLGGICDSYRNQGMRMFYKKWIIQSHLCLKSIFPSMQHYLGSRSACHREKSGLPYHIPYYANVFETGRTTISLTLSQSAQWPIHSPPLTVTGSSLAGRKVFSSSIATSSPRGHYGSWGRFVSLTQQLAKEDGYVHVYLMNYLPGVSLLHPGEPSHSTTLRLQQPHPPCLPSAYLNISQQISYIKSEIPSSVLNANHLVLIGHLNVDYDDLVYSSSVYRHVKTLLDFNPYLHLTMLITMHDPAYYLEYQLEGLLRSLIIQGAYNDYLYGEKYEERYQIGYARFNPITLHGIIDEKNDTEAHKKAALIANFNQQWAMYHRVMKNELWNGYQYQHESRYYTRTWIPQDTCPKTFKTCFHHEDKARVTQPEDKETDIKQDEDKKETVQEKPVQTRSWSQCIQDAIKAVKKQEEERNEEEEEAKSALPFNMGRVKQRQRQKARQKQKQRQRQQQQQKQRQHVFPGRLTDTLPPVGALLNDADRKKLSYKAMQRAFSYFYAHYAQHTLGWPKQWEAHPLPPLCPPLPEIYQANPTHATLFNRFMQQVTTAQFGCQTLPQAWPLLLDPRNHHETLRALILRLPQILTGGFNPKTTPGFSMWREGEKGPTILTYDGKALSQSNAVYYRPQHPPLLIAGSKEAKAYAVLRGLDSKTENQGPQALCDLINAAYQRHYKGIHPFTDQHHRKRYSHWSDNTTPVVPWSVSPSGFFRAFIEEPKGWMPAALLAAAHYVLDEGVMGLKKAFLCIAQLTSPGLSDLFRFTILPHLSDYGLFRYTGKLKKITALDQLPFALIQFWTKAVRAHSQRLRGFTEKHDGLPPCCWHTLEASIDALLDLHAYLVRFDLLKAAQAVLPDLLDHGVGDTDVESLIRRILFLLQRTPDPAEQLWALGKYHKKSQATTLYWGTAQWEVPLLEMGYVFFHPLMGINDKISQRQSVHLPPPSQQDKVGYTVDRYTTLPDWHPHALDAVLQRKTTQWRDLKVTWYRAYGLHAARLPATFTAFCQLLESSPFKHQKNAQKVQIIKLWLAGINTWDFSTLPPGDRYEQLIDTWHDLCRLHQTPRYDTAIDTLITSGCLRIKSSAALCVVDWINWVRAVSITPKPTLPTTGGGHAAWCHRDALTTLCADLPEYHIVYAVLLSLSAQCNRPLPPFPSKGFSACMAPVISQKNPDQDTGPFSHPYAKLYVLSVLCQDPATITTIDWEKDTPLRQGLATLPGAFFIQFLPQVNTVKSSPSMQALLKALRTGTLTPDKIKSYFGLSVDKYQQQSHRLKQAVYRALPRLLTLLDQTCREDKAFAAAWKLCSLASQDKKTLFCDNNGFDTLCQSLTVLQDVDKQAKSSPSLQSRSELKKLLTPLMTRIANWGKANFQALKLPRELQKKLVVWLKPLPQKYASAKQNLIHILATLPHPTDREHMLTFLLKYYGTSSGLLMLLPVLTALRHTLSSLPIPLATQLHLLCRPPRDTPPSDMLLRARSDLRDTLVSSGLSARTAAIIFTFSVPQLTRCAHKQTVKQTLTRLAELEKREHAQGMDPLAVEKKPTRCRVLIQRLWQANSLQDRPFTLSNLYAITHALLAPVTQYTDLNSVTTYLDWAIAWVDTHRVLIKVALSDPNTVGLPPVFSACTDVVSHISQTPLKQTKKTGLLKMIGTILSQLQNPRLTDLSLFFTKVNALLVKNEHLLSTRVDNLLATPIRRWPTKVEACLCVLSAMANKQTRMLAEYMQCGIIPSSRPLSPLPLHRLHLRQLLTQKGHRLWQYDQTRFEKVTQAQQNEEQLAHVNQKNTPPQWIYTRLLSRFRYTTRDGVKLALTVKAQAQLAVWISVLQETQLNLPIDNGQPAMMLSHDDLVAAIKAQVAAVRDAPDALANTVHLLSLLVALISRYGQGHCLAYPHQMLAALLYITGDYHDHYTTLSIKAGDGKTLIMQLLKLYYGVTVGGVLATSSNPALVERDRANFAPLYQVMPACLPEKAKDSMERVTQNTLSEVIFAQLEHENAGLPVPRYRVILCDEGDKNLLDDPCVTSDIRQKAIPHCDDDYAAINAVIKNEIIDPVLTAIYAPHPVPADARMKKENQRVFLQLLDDPFSLNRLIACFCTIVGLENNIDKLNEQGLTRHRLYQLLSDSIYVQTREEKVDYVVEEAFEYEAQIGWRGRIRLLEKEGRITASSLPREGMALLTAHCQHKGRFQYGEPVYQAPQQKNNATNTWSFFAFHCANGGRVASLTGTPPSLVLQQVDHPLFKRIRNLHFEKGHPDKLVVRPPVLAQNQDAQVAAMMDYIVGNTYPIQGRQENRPVLVFCDNEPHLRALERKLRLQMARYKAINTLHTPWILDAYPDRHTLPYQSRIGAPYRISLVLQTHARGINIQTPETVLRVLTAHLCTSWQQEQEARRTARQYYDGECVTLLDADREMKKGSMGVVKLLKANPLIKEKPARPPLSHAVCIRLLNAMRKQANNQTLSQKHFLTLYLNLKKACDHTPLIKADFIALLRAMEANIAPPFTQHHVALLLAAVQSHDEKQEQQTIPPEDNGTAALSHLKKAIAEKNGRPLFQEDFTALLTAMDAAHINCLLRQNRLSTLYRALTDTAHRHMHTLSAAVWQAEAQEEKQDKWDKAHTSCHKTHTPKQYFEKAKIALLQDYTKHNKAVFQFIVHFHDHIKDGKTLDDTIGQFHTTLENQHQYASHYHTLYQQQSTLLKKYQKQVHILKPVVSPSRTIENEKITLPLDCWGRRRVAPYQSYACLGNNDQKKMIQTAFFWDEWVLQATLPDSPFKPYRDWININKWHQHCLNPHRTSADATLLSPSLDGIGADISDKVKKDFQAALDAKKKKRTQQEKAALLLHQFDPVKKLIEAVIAHKDQNKQTADKAVLTYFGAQWDNQLYQSLYYTPLQNTFAKWHRQVLTTLQKARALLQHYKAISHTIGARVSSCRITALYDTLAHLIAPSNAQMATWLDEDVQCISGKPSIVQWVRRYTTLSQRVTTQLREVQAKLSLFAPHQVQPMVTIQQSLNQYHAVYQTLQTYILNSSVSRQDNQALIEQIQRVYQAQLNALLPWQQGHWPNQPWHTVLSGLAKTLKKARDYTACLASMPSPPAQDETGIAQSLCQRIMASVLPKSTLPVALDTNQLNKKTHLLDKLRVIRATCLTNIKQQCNKMHAAFSQHYYGLRVLYTLPHRRMLARLRTRLLRTQAMIGVLTYMQTTPQITKQQITTLSEMLTAQAAHLIKLAAPFRATKTQLCLTVGCTVLLLPLAGALGYVIATFALTLSTPIATIIARALLTIPLPLLYSTGLIILVGLLLLSVCAWGIAAYTDDGQVTLTQPDPILLTCSVTAWLAQQNQVSPINSNTDRYGTPAHDDDLSCVNKPNDVL